MSEEREEMIKALRGDRSAWPPIDPKANYRTLPVALCEAAANNLASYRPDGVGGEDETARILRGYRAAAHWIGSDSWDGCPECIEILRLAAEADPDRALTADQIALALRELRVLARLPALPVEGGEDLGSLNSRDPTAAELKAFADAHRASVKVIGSIAVTPQPQVTEDDLAPIEHIVETVRIEPDEIDPQFMRAELDLGDLDLLVRLARAALTTKGTGR